MKRWFLIVLLASVWFLFSHDASATIDASPTSKESTYLDSDFQQGWAHLPQAQTRTHNISSFVYLPSLVFKGQFISQEQILDQRAFLIEQKEKILLRTHSIELGFTDIQRIFPFHQFW